MKIDKKIVEITGFRSKVGELVLFVTLEDGTQQEIKSDEIVKALNEYYLLAQVTKVATDYIKTHKPSPGPKADNPPRGGEKNESNNRI